MVNTPFRPVVLCCPVEVLASSCERWKAMMTALYGLPSFLACLLLSLGLFSTAVSGCGWWSQSTKDVPLPEGAWAIQNGHHQSFNTYICKCSSVNVTGNLMPYNGPNSSLVCAWNIDNQPTGYCWAGDYSVLIKRYLGKDPTFVNVSSEEDIPPVSKLLPGPGSRFSCIAFDQVDYYPDVDIGGSLVNSSWYGEWVCQYSVVYSLGTVSGQAHYGQFAAVVGSECLLPPASRHPVLIS